MKPFIQSPTAYIRILCVIILLGSAVLFLTRSVECEHLASWYTWLYPVAAIVVILLIAFNLAILYYGTSFENMRWLVIDGVHNAVEAIIIMVTAHLTLSECKIELKLLPLSLFSGDIVGILLIISSVVLYFDWKKRRVTMNLY